MADFDKPQSRTEAVLQNILGAENELSAPQSRIEAILQNILGAENELSAPQSRVEELLMAILEQGGGGDSSGSLSALIDGSIVSVTSDVTSIRAGVFDYCTQLQDISFPNCTVLNASVTFSHCEALTRIGANSFPKLTTLTGGNSCFSSCKSLTVVVFPMLTNVSNTMLFSGCNSLEIVDYPTSAIQSATFQNCTALKTLVLRKDDAPVSLASLTNTFKGTPFASDGSGGTIYIPKALYDHLRDGSSLDYKAATNWSTVDGYGTITWAQIEGSIYETQYADGTPIT